MNLNLKAKEIRQGTFETIINAGKGHIGGSFSCVEILTALYYGILKESDIFILSKGHACCVLYNILADKGYFPKSILGTFAKEGSPLEAHVSSLVPGVKVSTGSLGLGIGIGSGVALADKLDNKDRKVVVLMGDGECQEGSVWESAMFAAHHKLSNLIVIIDRNNQAVLDFLDNYNDIEPLADKWKAFGWDVWETDNGHDIDKLTSFIKHVYNLDCRHVLTHDSFAYEENARPKLLIINTVKGKGVSFMERVPIWHHQYPNPEQIEQARRELWT